MSREELNRQAFKEEALELLGELETSLLELEEDPANDDVINRVFRAMHTIKGSGAMFGFEDIASFTHEVETVFDLARNGQISVSKELLDLTLLARDHILSMLEGEEQGLGARAAEVIQGLKALTPSRKEPEAAPAGMETATNCATNSKMNTWRIRFAPPKNLFMSGTNPASLLEELCEMGEHHVIMHTKDIPALPLLNPEDCLVWWDIILTTAGSEDEIRDVFIFVEEDSDLTIQMVGSCQGIDEESYKLIGQILVEKNDITKDALERILLERKPIGQLLSEAGLVSASQVEAALVEQQEVKRLRQTASTEAQASSIRVPAQKLDFLVDLVGELVTAQARLTQFASEQSDARLQAISEEIERLSDELRDNTLGIRMLPIGSTFSRFKRLVRDLSQELGKRIVLETHGEDTELDKTVIERLNDPLVHLLRNSIDHGIESPEERMAQGKNPEGRIELSAEHSGGEVLIRIIDDGAGIDPERIRAKAVEKGIIAADTLMTDKDALMLIFAPGFSTADKVTSVSGRGVGMDVVKRNIDALRGRISLESVPGQGTTISVRIPLTLAIIDGLQVQVEDSYFIMPLSAVEECVELIRKDKDRADLINLRGQMVPYISLRAGFEIPGQTPEIEQVVVCNSQGRRVGIVVDRVIGEHQTVIKSLGKVYQDIRGISGATIKGDGSMALILDIAALVA
ncbi:two-component system, chemotaxis family, sensor kinase CheA [Desulfomicrobium norvegicum]|uniref:Chemotaxis protein CheA n=1 Tax=Desulfomicrobium norvegicum (strain DSM 1741 / NCIMB 8310) TaxID=52561 RepID=A0A8G2FE99_DESNO|nr:chemotaxis protein CheA [Desulfomicrobium norvegicum]SFL71125.1 two-component system, chemotaxis family, sensor kinase CheA [Desulfomicrobium norvegicum]